MLKSDWTFEILNPPIKIKSGKNRISQFNFPDYTVIWTIDTTNITIQIKPEFLRRDDITNYLDEKKAKHEELKKKREEEEKAKSIFIILIENKKKEKDITVDVPLSFNTEINDLPKLSNSNEWSCTACTFINNGNNKICEICGTPKY